METERLNIFDEHHQLIGTATRQDAHKHGYWHETFHCWFVGREKDRLQLYFQIRSKQKADYPSLLDITVAGHLLSDETVEDGIREIEEEVGVKLDFNELTSLGKLSYTLLNNEKIDREIAHIFLYQFAEQSPSFLLQQEEVSGVVKVDFEEFALFWENEQSSIKISGFEIEGGTERSIFQTVTKQNFVQHSDAYFEKLINKIREAQR